MLLHEVRSLDLLLEVCNQPEALKPIAKPDIQEIDVRR